MNLQLVDMNVLPDDVEISVSRYYPNLFDLPGMSGPLTIYEDIKRLAVERVRQRKNPKEYLVEIVRNSDGYPTAYTWLAGKVVGKLGVLDSDKQGNESERLDEVWSAI